MAQIDSEIDVLNHMLYTLEENFVVAVTKEDASFRNYIVGLYSDIDHKISDLSKKSRA